MTRNKRTVFEVSYAICMIPMIYVYSFLIWPMYNSTMIYLESRGSVLSTEENWDFIGLIAILFLVFRLGSAKCRFSYGAVLETIIFLLGLAYFSMSYFVPSFFSLTFIFLAVLPITFSLFRLYLIFNQDIK